MNLIFESLATAAPQLRIEVSEAMPPLVPSLLTHALPLLAASAAAAQILAYMIRHIRDTGLVQRVTRDGKCLPGGKCFDALLEILQLFLVDAENASRRQEGEALEDEDLRLLCVAYMENREIRVFHSISAVYGMSEHIILYDYSIA